MTLRKFGVEHQKVEVDPADEQGFSKTALHHLATAEDLPEEEDEGYDKFINHRDPCDGED